MRYFHLLFMVIFLISIFTMAPVNSIVELSENLSEKVSEEKNLEEDKDDKSIDNYSFYIASDTLLKNSYKESKIFKTTLYYTTLLRPPIFA